MATALAGLRRARPNDPETREAIDEVVDKLSEALDDTFSKAEAARLLEVSSPTLDAWIARGLLPVVQTPRYKRERIPADALVDVIAEVKELRRMGRKRGLLAEAIARLEDESDEVRNLRKRASRSFDRSKYMPAVPEDWDPED